jgi:hypothetical protein
MDIQLIWIGIVAGGLKQPTVRRSSVFDPNRAWDISDAIVSSFRERGAMAA